MTDLHPKTDSVFDAYMDKRNLTGPDDRDYAIIRQEISGVIEWIEKNGVDAAEKEETQTFRDRFDDAWQNVLEGAGNFRPDQKEYLLAQGRRRDMLREATHRMRMDEFRDRRSSEKP